MSNRPTIDKGVMVMATGNVKNKIKVMKFVVKKNKESNRQRKSDTLVAEDEHEKLS